MPRGNFQRRKPKWTKRDYDDPRDSDARGDYVRVPQMHLGRREQGGRRSTQSDVVRRAVAMNLLPASSGLLSQNSGLLAGENWARIIVIYGHNHGMVNLQEMVNTVLETQLRFYNAYMEGQNCVMHTKIRNKQLQIYRRSLSKLRDQSGTRMVADMSIVPEPRVPTSESGGFASAVSEKWTEALRFCFLERFQAATRSLDLSSLHTDPTLLSQGLYLPLNKSPVAYAMVNILRMNNAQLTTLNLSSNRLLQLSNFSSLASTSSDGEGPSVSVERIDLSANLITNFTGLSALRGLPGLVALDLTDNPVSSRTQQGRRATACALLKVLPGIRRLNGDDLPQVVQFAVEQVGDRASNIDRIPLPESILGYFPNDDVKLALLGFLKEYFTRYDSKPRGDNLLPYYTTASYLVLSVAADRTAPSNPQHASARFDSVNAQGEVTKVFLTTSRLNHAIMHKNRNLLLSSSDIRRKEMVARGSLGCASLLSDLPDTEHPLQSISVDVAFHSDSQMVFTVAGVFYEINEQETGGSGNGGSGDARTVISGTGGTGAARKGPKTVRKVLRCFSRTMILVAPGGHIVQDDLVIANPGPALCKKYITNVAAKSTAQAKPPATTALPLPPPATAAAVMHNEQMLITQLRAHSGMNDAFARQCLEEYQWDLEKAVQAFRMLQEAGKLPPAAFV